MFNARSTFNAAIIQCADNGIPIHFELDEITLWPSYRVAWFDAVSTSPGKFRSLVMVSINVNGKDTAGLWKRADRFTKALGIDGNDQKMKVLMQDWTDPLNPVNLDDVYHNWIEYGFRFNRGWTVEQPPDPDSRILTATLELEYYDH